MSMLLVLSDSYADKAAKLASELSDRIQVEIVHSYEAANTASAAYEHKILFIQNQLADGNAFDFCTRYRLLSGHQMTPILVFSEQDDKKERVQTFQVGADEYITEFDIEFIKAVVDHEIQSNEQLDQLEKEKAQASNLVMEAMKTSSELGNAINFIERCHRFQSNEEIAKEIINFCKSLDLKVVIGIMEEGFWTFSSSTGNVADLESELMQSIHQQDRFVDFGGRTQMNWPNIALLVKNMPIRDPEKYGRVKDLLPTLLSSANVRIHSLYEESRIKEQTNLMTRSIETLQPQIEEVIKAMKRDNKDHRDALSAFLQRIIIALPGLGLEEDQEEFFVNSVESLIQGADDMAGRSEHHQETLETTNQVLVTLLQKQHQILELISKPVEIADKAPEAEDDLFELF